MVSVGISKLGCTDLVFVDLGVRINGAWYRNVLVSKQLLPVMREVSGEFFVFQLDSAPAHRHATLCDFSSNAGFRSTGSLASEHALIRLITGSGALSNSECTSRGCTTPTNWNSVCSKCGVTSTRASLTMQLMQLTSGASDTSSVCCRKQYAYLQSTVWQHKRFSFLSNATRFWLLLF